MYEYKYQYDAPMVVADPLPVINLQYLASYYIVYE